MTEETKKLIESVTVFTQYDVVCSGGLTEWVGKSDFDRVVEELTKWNKVEECLPDINRRLLVKSKIGIEYLSYYQINGKFTSSCKVAYWRYIY